MIKIAKQGEITIEGKDSYISLKVNAFEPNNNGSKPFRNEFKIQPHRVFDLLDVIDGNCDFTAFKSGMSVMKVKYKPEKNGIRLTFRKDDASSSFLIINTKLNAFRKELIEAIRKLKVVSVSDENCHIVRTGDYLLLKNHSKEIFLTKAEANRLKELILHLSVVGPINIKTRIYSVHNGDLYYRGVFLPKSILKKLYVLI